MTSKRNMQIAIVLGVLVVILFIVLGFFGVGRTPTATQAKPLTGAQELLKQIAATGGVSTLQKYDTVAGSGPGAGIGDTVIVQYTGALPDGTVFDSSRQAGREPFAVVLGQNRVIQGWEQGLAGVKKGERFILAIPPALAYGNNAVGSIPPNSTLIFDIEVIDIIPAQSAQ